MVRLLFQHTAARRRLAFKPPCQQMGYKGFNTQPPEGGWIGCGQQYARLTGFNTQPPEGGWANPSEIIRDMLTFQHTAARRRLELRHVVPCFHHGFNTQPPEGGWTVDLVVMLTVWVSTHSRPKAAGFRAGRTIPKL